MLNFDLIVSGPKNEKIKDFIVIKNTLFHDLKLGYRVKYGIMREGVYISQIGLNSPFSELTLDNLKNYKTDGDLLLISLNSNKLSDINSLIDTFKKICDRSNLFMEAIDLNMAFSRADIYPIDFGEIKDISKLTFNEELGLWKNNTIELQ